MCDERPERRSEVTRMLRAGDRDGLLALVYDELRLLAAGRMRPERNGHTLQATALVHEAWLRLLDEDVASCQGRRHFFALASEAMHRILVEHARKVGAVKRGGKLHRVTLGTVDMPVDLDIHQVVALNDALDVLEKEDARAASVARLRFLAGLSVEETADTLSISPRSVHREWKFARARLFELLGL